MARIVVGVDGSEHSKQALRWALQEARLRGASLEAVHAWTIPVYNGYGFGAVPIDPEALRDGAREMLDVAVDAVVTGAKDVLVDRKVVEGLAARALVEEAGGADLLVVGSRGLGGFKGLIMGSVSHQCTSHATCPVVIVPHLARI